MSEERPEGTPGPIPTKSYPPELKWEEPDQSRRVEDLHLYREVLKKVQSRPGQWARIRVMTQSSAYSTRKRLKKVLTVGDQHWEFAVASVPGLGSEMKGVYARYRTDEQLQEEGDRQ